MGAEERRGIGPKGRHGRGEADGARGRGRARAGESREGERKKAKRARRQPCRARNGDRLLPATARTRPRHSPKQGKQRRGGRLPQSKERETKGATP